jgi:hypothetical protein
MGERTPSLRDCRGTGLWNHDAPTFVPSPQRFRSKIYRGPKEEANRVMADASPSPACRRGSAKGKRKILRFCVVAGNPMSRPRSVGVRESDAAQIGVVELVLAIGKPLGAIPSK